MKIKTLLQAPEILQKAKELNIDLTTLDPKTRVKLIDGGLHFEGEKECFVSKPAPIETPLEICKRLYFEGVQFEVCTKRRIQTIPNVFQIDYEYGDVVLYLQGQKYTLYSKSFDSFVKIIEPSGNSEPEYYYLSQSRTNDNRDFIQLNDEYCDNSTGFYSKVLEKWVNFQSWTLPQIKFRRKIQKNTVEEPEYYYLKEGDVIEEGDEVENSRSVFEWEKSIFVGEEVTRNSLKYRRKIQKNPTL